jgi:predicted DNA-binding ribbon-helix-helix protein
MKTGKTESWRVRLKPGSLAKLKRIAARENRSLANLIGKIVEEFLRSADAKSLKGPNKDGR